MNFESIQEKLKITLDEERYLHTIGVMYTAGALAMAHGYDVTKAMLAGLLHDCAKCMTHEERVALCEKHGVEISPSEHKNFGLLHAKAGALLAKDVYDIVDKEILHAIAVHTTGVPEMNVLDKIVYIADYIEPERKEILNISYVRKLAFQDLDACMGQILYDSLNHLQTKNLVIDPHTAEAYDYYKQFRKEE